MFSRLKRLVFRWRFQRAKSDDIDRANVIVVQAYSRSRDGKDAGQANAMLATYARMLQEEFGYLILSMTEIELADPDLRVLATYRGHTGGHSTHDCNTYTIAEFHAEYCRKCDFRRVVLVASSDHIGRCKWVYERLGLEGLPFSVDIDACMSSDYLHWSHRTRMRFVVREFCVRLMFLAKGYI